MQFFFSRRINHFPPKTGRKLATSTYSEIGKADMLHQPRHCYQLVTCSTYSAFSLPEPVAESSYHIHLVKCGDEDYIPEDMEVWPVYHSAIILALRDFPDAHQAAVDAVLALQQRLKGCRNRDLPRH